MIARLECAVVILCGLVLATNGYAGTTKFPRFFLVVGVAFMLYGAIAFYGSRASR